MTNEDIQLTLRIQVKLNSILNDLDKLSHSVHYKRRYKQVCENFYRFAERECEGTTRELLTSQNDIYAKMVYAFDKLGEKMIIEK